MRHANSFWVEGYFEETKVAPIRVGDPVQIKLMGHRQILRGLVDSITRANTVMCPMRSPTGVAP
jgi:multidrug resistance efflux pump